MKKFECVSQILFFSNLIFLQECNNFFQLTVNRTDILCPSECDQELVVFQRYHCCACRAKYLWQADYKRQIDIVYNDSIGRYMIQKPSKAYSQLYIYHQNGRLTGLPENICLYKNIAYMDFSYNDISNIDGISCVENLDTLILRGNKIEYLKNTTFLGMKYIRQIDLSYNNLKYIEPGFLYNIDGSLFLFDVSHNSLTIVDISNLIFGKQSFFCRTDFSHNKIQRISNDLGWICKDNDNYGDGGFIDLSYNNFTHFFNLSQIGFKSLLQLGGKVLFYGFDLTENNWICDCQFHSFLIAVTAFREFEHYFQLPCKSPAQFVGKYIIDFLHDNALDQLICNLSMTDKCPPKCYCFDQPELRRTVVNCSGSRLSKMPPALPERLNLNVDLSDNQISNINNVFNFSEKGSASSYVERIKTLDLSRNKIEIIPENMFYSLRNLTLVDLSYNDFVRIPRSLQVMNPCQVLLRSVLMKCTCDDLWINQWLPSNDGKCWGNVEIYCMGSYGTRHITNMTKQLLGCNVHDDVTWISSVLVTTCLVIIIITFLSFTFRLEIFIVTRQILKHLKRREILRETYPFHVYISSNEDDNTLRLWLTTTFVPYLERQGFRVFLPYRDCNIGRPREEEIIEVAPKCLNFIIFLSEKYRGSINIWVQKEWKYSWHSYKSDLDREIIVVNYDMLKYNDMSKTFLRAFIRLRKFIDFSNHNNLIEKNITSSLQNVISEEDVNQRNSTSTDPQVFLLNNLYVNYQNDVPIFENNVRSNLF